MKRVLALLAVVVLFAGAAFFAARYEMDRRLSAVPAVARASATPEPTAASSATPTPLPVSDASFDVYFQGQVLQACDEDAAVPEQVFTLTGVRIGRRFSPDGGDVELLTLLASGLLPDAVVFSSPELLQRFREAGALLPLNDLVLAHCPQVVSVNWEKIAGRLTDEDGALWALPSLYYMDGSRLYPETDLGLTVSSDVFSSAPATLEEGFGILRAAGRAAALPLSTEDDLDALAAWIAGYSGLPFSEYVVRAPDGAAAWLGAQSAFRDALFSLNAAYREGLVRVCSGPEAVSLCLSGEAAAYIGHGWNIAVPAAEAADEGAGPYWATVFPSSGTPAFAAYTFGVRGTGIALCVTCGDPARFVQFYGWANGETGHLALMGVVDYGFGGANTPEKTKGFDFIAVGKSKLFPDRTQVYQSGWMLENYGEAYVRRRGVYLLSAFSYALRANHPEGVYDCIGTEDVSSHWTEELGEVYARFGITGEGYFDRMRAVSCDVSDLAGLPSNETLAGRTRRAIRELMTAGSEAEFELLYRAYLGELSAPDAQAHFAALDSAHLRRLARWAEGIRPLPEGSALFVQ